MKPPSSVPATDASRWLELTRALTRVSPPTGRPFRPNTCANSPSPEPSALSHTTTKPPCGSVAEGASAATTGVSCAPAVVVLTCVSPDAPPTSAEPSKATSAPVASMRWAKTPFDEPSAAASTHTTSTSPSGRRTAAGSSWLCAIVVLTRNSPPSGVPSAANSRANTPLPEPSPAGPEVCDTHTARKRPASSATSWPSNWAAWVCSFTRNAGPCAAPSASKRRANRPEPEPSRLLLSRHSATKPPPGRPVAAGSNWSPRATSLIWNSAPISAPSAPKRWAKIPRLKLPGASWFCEVHTTR